MLGLGYPGGPAIQRAAEGVETSLTLPRAWLGDSLEFSFSGLKTALLHKVQELGVYPPPPGGPAPDVVAELASAFQTAVVDVIATKAAEAVRRHGASGLVLGGGVSANALLRRECAARSPVPVIIPAPRHCTDNAAMIGVAGSYALDRGITHGLELDAVPSLALA